MGLAHGLSFRVAPFNARNTRTANTHSRLQPQWLDFALCRILLEMTNPQLYFVALLGRDRFRFPENDLLIRANP